MSQENAGDGTQPDDQPSPTEQASGDGRFNILICVDGSEAAFQALKYAVRIGSGTDADMTLLYVRPVDQGLRTGGLQISVARENLLDWGLELPGKRTLRKSHDMLIDLGFLGEDWEEDYKHTDVHGDPLGDNVIAYTSDEGRHISLKLMVSPSVLRGILDECEMGDYDIVIVAKSTDPDDTGGPGKIDPTDADAIAIEHRGTVLVARGIEESHGHLLCVSNNELSIAAAKRDAMIASRCACPVYLFSVARDETERDEAKEAITKARAAIEELGVGVSGETIEIGDPVERIVKAGRDYSVIVLSGATQKGWRRFFTSSVSYRVLEKAQNSVMIAR